MPGPPRKPDSQVAASTRKRRRVRDRAKQRAAATVEGAEELLAEALRIELLAGRVRRERRRHLQYRTRGRL